MSIKRVTKSNGEIYEIIVAEPHHLPEVVRVMRENFYHDEAMFHSLCSNVKIHEKEMKEINEYFDGTVVAAFEASPCFIAVNVKTLLVVGANLTILSENPTVGNKRDGLATIFPSEDVSVSPLIKKYTKYLTKINEEVRIFDAFPDARIVWEFYAIAIDKNHRRFGLAGDLMNFGIIMAREANVSLVFGVFTSIYSSRSAEKVGMKPFAKFHLSRYVEEDGSLVFHRNNQHDNVVTIMVRKLS